MVRLRNVVKEDLEMIMNWRMDPEVTKYMYTDPVLTLEKQLEWFNKIENSTTEKYWVIEIEKNIPVGVINLASIDYVNKSACWAYYLGSLEARGKGLARKLECNIYDYVFGVLGLNKLWCEVIEFNKDVISIHEKFGSKIEGKLIDHICKNDNYYSVYRMAILKSEWELLRGNISYEKIDIQY